MIEISELTRVKVLNKTMETYGQIKGGDYVEMVCFENWAILE